MALNERADSKRWRKGSNQLNQRCSPCQSNLRLFTFLFLPPFEDSIYGNSCWRILDVDPGPCWCDLGVMIGYCIGYAGIKETGGDGQSDCLIATYCQFSPT